MVKNQVSGIEVVVTGASGGIGSALCKQLCERGLAVIGISRRAPEGWHSAHYRHLSIDLMEPSAPEQVAMELVSKAKVRLRVVVHAAAILHARPFELLDEQLDDEMLRLNLRLPIALTRVLLPWLRSANESHSVFISSMAGFQGSLKYSGLSVYGATKAGLVGFTEAIAAEYQGTGLYFNALCLGAVQTEMLSKAFPNYEGGVTVDEMARFISSFALNGHKVMNGKALPVSIDNPR